MSKKLFLIIAIFSVIISLAACNNKTATPTDTSVASENVITPEASGTPTATPDESTAPTAPESTDTQTPAATSDNTANTTTSAPTANSTAGTTSKKTNPPASATRPTNSQAPSTTKPTVSSTPPPATSTPAPTATVPKSDFEKPYNLDEIYKFAKKYGEDNGMTWDEALTPDNCSSEAPLHTSSFTTEAKMKSVITSGIDRVKSIQIRNGYQPGEYHFRLYLSPIGNGEYLMYWLIG